MASGTSEETEPAAHMDIPELSREEALARLEAHGRDKTYIRAFYSSILGGLVRDPDLALVPLDDHMVHRGHAVFDTCTVIDGTVYQLDQHLARFQRSADLAKLTLPFPIDQIKDIILRVCGVAKDGRSLIRYWASAGPGGFGVSQKECTAAFYVVATVFPISKWAAMKGVHLVTSSLPVKPAILANMKSNNYMLNAILQTEAEERGATFALQVDHNGHITESSMMNIAYLDAGGVLYHPAFDLILRGCTISRVFELAESDEGKALGISKVVVGDIPVERARADAVEMIIVGGTTVIPIISWDGKPVGSGGPGEVAQGLEAMLRRDEKGGGTSQCIELPDE